jgi:hypothetical protein
MSVASKEKSKISKRMQLKPNHSTMKKIEKLCETADKLGIAFYFSNMGVVVTDESRDKTLPDLILEDIEEGEIFCSFPFELEYKVCYDNPEYLKQERLEWEAKLARETQVQKEKEELRRKKEDERRVQAAKEAEEAERKLYEKLKKKYETA